jgi:hypothetical protein
MAAASWSSDSGLTGTGAPAAATAIYSSSSLYSHQQHMSVGSSNSNSSYNSSYNRDDNADQSGLQQPPQHLSVGATGYGTTQSEGGYFWYYAVPIWDSSWDVHKYNSSSLLFCGTEVMLYGLGGGGGARIN